MNKKAGIAVIILVTIMLASLVFVRPSFGSVISISNVSLAPQGSET